MLPRRHALAEYPSGTMRTNVASVSAAPAPQVYSASPALAPSPSVTRRPHKRLSFAWKIGTPVLGFLLGGTFGITGGFLLSMLYKKIMSTIRGRGKNMGPSIYSPLIKKPDHLAFLEKEDALQLLEIIGRGGCGIVYNAELPGSEGKVIAIKKITQPPKEATELTEEDSRSLNRKMRQIRAEIRIMGEIRHKNLLPLLAHLSRPDCHYLVYEFMKNGSLQDVMEKVSRGTGELDWLSRHRIALGTAAGLEYLHYNYHRKVIQRDLKPANVLLDDDMEPRIADFGLAKEMREEETHVTGTSVVGTLGYIAPEYHSTMKFTEKSDMYSYGVMLGALVMGKLPSDEFFQNTPEMGMVKWVRNVVGWEEPGKGLDEKLIGRGYEEEMVMALKVAYLCTCLHRIFRVKFD